MSNLLESFPEGTLVHELDLSSGIHMRAYETKRGAGEGTSERTALFLHGFPELAYSWREQLAACPPGFRCIAPDMRGYGGTDGPEEVSEYAMTKLVADVIALADALGIEKFDLVGHDWGGAIAWEVARAHPERLRTLTVMNCPPADVFLRELRRPKQLLSSWYMFFFQLPFVPEWYLTRDPARQLRNAFLGLAVNEAPFTEEHVAHYEGVMRGKRVCGIQYYRAAMRGLAKATARRKSGIIRVPTRLVWGLGDRALGPWYADANRYENVATPFDVVTIAESGHWVQQEAPLRANAALHEHWAKH